MARNSKIIIAKNIRLDKEYKEVLNYSENDMLTLVNTNKVDSADQYNFIKDDGVISTHFDYADALKCNYMAFQNPNYANKWFFAFIDDVKYINDGTTQIFFTIDFWSTWFSSLTVGTSFVIREHVNNDSVGANTLPENFETGEYIINALGSIDDNDDGLKNTFICMGVSWAPENIPVGRDNRQFGGVYSGLNYFIFSTPSDCSLMIKAYDDLAKADAIYTIFLIPRALVNGITWYTFNLGNQENIVASFPPNSTFSNVLVSGVEIESPTKLNGYTPKNNKLFCYPFNYLYITNNNGADVIYNYEDFVNNTPKFTVDGVLTTGCSIKLHPNNYKKISTFVNHPKMESCFGIVGGKYPTCSWDSDPYTNWLTQNAINIPIQITAGLSTATFSAISGNVGGTIGGALSIGSSISSIYEHSLVPLQAKGNISAGDVTQGMRMNTFSYYKMSIKEEYARCIDDYFTRFGYKVNRNKIPNITGRRYWNYIQIANEDNLGFGEIPSNYLDEINKIARRGVTIWHSHDNIGNYSLNNTIL